MARFVISVTDGKFEAELEGEPGEEISPEIVSAYSMMQVGHALGDIAESLEKMSRETENIADELRRYRVG